ncbi:palmitoyltransferase ZDHHC23 isoform X2 [Pyxicephalus adspersus]|uniref:palmitoyltransferase ZDHHC23 isoform X2 n=1 Tax=Pyxicephalus adspersus TaxID=30357 RepID=UPI003B5AA9B7
MKGVRKKKGTPITGGDPDDVLCCCEYINQKGDRSHVAACLCDCEDLDEACDRWITCKSLQPEVLARVMETASDRFRFPWIRGAKKVDLSILPPLVLLPVSLYMAAFHVLLGVVILSSLPVLVIWYYQLTHRRKGKTLLFLSLVLFSLGYMYYTFVREVFLKGHIGWGHLTAITGGLLMTLLLLAKAKQDPGYLNKRTIRAKTGSNGSLNGVLQKEEEPESPPGLSEDREKEFLITDKNWCKVCQVVRVARSGHCRICGSCVLRLDHHCVCGITITLRALCRDQYIVSALFYCPGVYADYSTSFAFTCAWYCTIVTAGIAYLLLVQLLNISYNVTEREARIALRERTGRSHLGGLVVDPRNNNQGLYQNWLHFLSLDSRNTGNNLSTNV